MPRLPARSIVLLLLVATASVIVPRADAQQRLRKLVEVDAAAPRYIQTVWGVGYVFVPDGTS